MTNVIKKSVKKVRDTFMRDVMKAVDDVSDDLKSTRAEIRETQLAINHTQLQLLKETNDRVKNIGTIVLSETEMISKIFSGLKIYMDPRDIAVAPHLALDGIWEHRITAAWLAAIKDTDTILDIGANFGYFGAIAAQLTDKKKSKVIYFEANPHLIPYLEKTLGVNWLNEQSVIENLAISDKPGEVTLHLLKDYIGSSSVQSAEEIDKYMHSKMHIETQEKIKVKAVTIDDYCRDNNIKTVNLIKMDIEGYEETAYKGMKKIIQASPNITLFIEFTKEGYKAPKSFYEEMLKDFGYVYTIADDGYIEKPKNISYEAIVSMSDDWVMPIFSKNPNLANRP